MERRSSRRAAIQIAAALAVAMAVVGAGLAGAAPAEAAAIVPFGTTPLAGDRLDGAGLAVVQVGTTAYVGGSFHQVRNQAGALVASRANLAAFDLRTGRLLTAFRADTDGPVRALASDGRRLFVGGSYLTIRGLARSRVAAVDLVSGAVDPAFRADANSNVYGLAVGGGALVLGGSFSSVAGRTRSRLAVVATTTGALQAVAPSFNATVGAVGISADGRRLVAGGSFTAVNGRAQRWAAVLDGTTGALAPAQLSPVEGPLSAIVLPAGGLYLAASMSGAGNSGNRYRLSDGRRTWLRRCDGDGQAIEEYAGTVYSGFHEGCGGDHAVRLTADDAATGVRNVAFRPTFDLFWGVRGLDASPLGLAVAGEFTRISGVAVQGLAIFPPP